MRWDGGLLKQFRGVRYKLQKLGKRKTSMGDLEARILALECQYTALARVLIAKEEVDAGELATKARAVLAKRIAELDALKGEEAGGSGLGAGGRRW